MATTEWEVILECEEILKRVREKFSRAFSIGEVLALMDDSYTYEEMYRRLAKLEREGKLRRREVYIGKKRRILWEVVKDGGDEREGVPQSGSGQGEESESSEVQQEESGSD